jgi:RNA polymerase sigma factor (sigma-70 family)
LKDPSAVSAALIQRALQGEREAERLLVEQLVPRIRAGVARALRKRSTARGGARPEVDDLTQGVLLSLFADGGLALRRWDPERGLALGGFVALVAHRQAVAVLRCRRRSPWQEDPTEIQSLDRHPAEAAGPESAAISRQIRAVVTDRARASLSPRGRELFALLFEHGCSTEDVCLLKGMSPGAVHAWRSRLARLARRIGAELLAGPTLPGGAAQSTGPLSSSIRKATASASARG